MFDDALSRLKMIIASMQPGGDTNAVVAAFDSSDMKDAIKKLQTDV